jgi:hypothetical protein
MAGAASTPSFAAGLFEGLAGAWRGEGSIGWTTGETERIRCTAKYVVGTGGNQLVQNLTCATDSTRLVVKSDITYVPAAGALRGSWSETTYGINGNVTGRANAATIRANVQSNDKRFTALVVVTTKGDEQSVTITPEGIDVTGVSVTLRRSADG